MNVNPPKNQDYFFANTRPAWPKWLERFQSYRLIIGLKDKPQRRQVDTLIYVMGDQAEAICKQIIVADEDEEQLYV